MSPYAIRNGTGFGIAPWGLILGLATDSVLLLVLAFLAFLLTPWSIDLTSPVWASIEEENQVAPAARKRPEARTTRS